MEFISELRAKLRAAKARRKRWEQKYRDLGRGNRDEGKAFGALSAAGEEIRVLEEWIAQEEKGEGGDE
jgi:hypothetical protein